jgi:hypothetical protein
MQSTTESPAAAAPNFITNTDIIAVTAAVAAAVAAAAAASVCIDIGSSGGDESTEMIQVVRGTEQCKRRRRHGRRKGTSFSFEQSFLPLPSLVRLSSSHCIIVQRRRRRRRHLGRRAR